MNRSRAAALAAIGSALAACGGRLADDSILSPNGDASSDASAPSDVVFTFPDTGKPETAPPPPPPPTCTEDVVDEETDQNGVCSITQSWSCGGTPYSVQCNCWAQTCECYEYGDKKLAFGFVEGCPSCTAGEEVIAKCGFPH